MTISIIPTTWSFANNCDTALGLRDSLTLRFSWESLPDAPAGILGTSPPVVIGSLVYFYAAHPNSVHKLYTDQKLWSTVLTPPNASSFTLVNIQDTLTAVGGKNGSGSCCLNNLKRFVNKKWVEDIVPMPTERQSPSVVYANYSLVVAGGLTITGDFLSVVELLNIRSDQWSAVSSLPFQSYSSSASVCGDYVYIQACTASDSTQHEVFECSITALNKSEPSSTEWKMIQPSPLSKSSLVTVNNTLLAVGGRHADEIDSENIYRYSLNNKKWQLVGKMLTPCCYCITASSSGNKLLVVGGKFQCKRCGDGHNYSLAK